ncbi:MAG: bifunctional aspartate kinase/homoserine dehydrogenase I [Flavobacteriales bacterium]|nr:MAG: bifunctional aspartate kinase/homoserine dehydrogenase I [Flavobacteriales bacterium]
MKLLKFGGTSVSSPERIEHVIQIVAKSSKKEKIAVVFSAFGGVTDKLIETAKLAAAGNKKYILLFNELENRHIRAIRELFGVKHQTSVLAQAKMTLNELEDILSGIFLIRELSIRSLDLIISFGERLSAYIISKALRQQVNCEFLDARKLVKTDNHFGNAQINFSKTNQIIRSHFKNRKPIQIITGFIGSTDDNITTTLGRGGSDFTAAIFAAALKAKELEIWTDVNGVLTADPRKVKKAFSIASLSYEEAMELSHFGAKVIYPPTIQPVLDQKIPIRIRNTHQPDFGGTLICKKPEKETTNALITGISSIDDIALLRLSGSGMVGVKGTSKRLFGTLAKHNVNIILITQASSEHTICFAVLPVDAARAKQAIEEEFALEMQSHLIDEVLIEKDLSIMAIVGENMRHIPGIAGKLFQSLGFNGVNVVAVAQGSSELNVSVVIAKKDLRKALNAIHESFFLSDTKTLNLFIVGTGLVGKTLFSQMKKQIPKLLSENALDVRVVGLSNSRKMVFNEDGISLNGWEKRLNGSERKSSIEKFVKTMQEMNLRNSIFIDNTASETVSCVYEVVLDSSISIVTPNKIACSGKYSNYKKLKNLAAQRGVSFLFETNVGAGLPVLSTLNDLISSGDKILKIEGVLSGSLSYIFDALMEGNKFSQAVEEAVKIGFAEPDPRLDLEGTDVARKALILARESGLIMELKNVKVENLVPKSCRNIDHIGKLFKALKNHDVDFKQLAESAKKSDKKLKYIASIEKDKASASLQAIDSRHPFYTLEGNDNVVSFTTERYKARPLIVRGPGAGAEVTAAGIFADIVRISNL